MICRVRDGGIAALVLAAAWLALAGCASTQRSAQTPPTGGGDRPHYKVGAPYKISGRLYKPREDSSYDKKGVASWYGDAFHGKPTANGEIFDQHRLSAAHTTLPLPSLVEVENLENGRRIVVRVNDRGPFVDDRLIDLSRAAADALGFLQNGLARVRVKFLGYADLHAKAPVKGNDAGARPIRLAQPPISKPAPLNRPPSVKPQQTSPGDLIGQLIEENARPPTPSMAPAPVASGLLYWVEIETFYDLDTLENAQLSLERAGPLAVFSKEIEGISIHTLRMGPYGDPGVAESHAAKAIAAGFANARLVDARF